MRRQFFLGAMATVLGAISSLSASGHGRGRARRRYGDRRRRAPQPGEVIDLVARRYSGEVLRADRGKRDGRATYRLKVLTERGEVLSIEVDAAMGAILSILGRSR